MLNQKIKLENKMIRPDEGSKLFFLIVIANIVTQLVFSYFFIQFENTDTIFQLFATLIMQLVFFALYFWMVPSKRRFLRWPLTNTIKDKPKNIQKSVIVYALAALLGILSLAAFFLPTVWFDWLISLTGYEASGLAFTNAGEFIFGGIIVVLIAPVVEELIYRGALLSGLSRQTGTVGAIFLSSLAFMLSHMNPSQTLYQFLLAVVCGFAVAYSGKLISGIIIHAVSNLLALIMEILSFYVPAFGSGLDGAILYLAENPLVGAAVTAGFFIVAGGLIVLILYFYKKTADKEAELPPLKETVYKVKLPAYMANLFAPGVNPYARPFDPFAAAPKPLDPFADPAEEKKPGETQDPSAPGKAEETLGNNAETAQAEPEPDPVLTELMFNNRKTNTWLMYGIGCAICFGMWVLVLLSGMIVGAIL